MVAIFWIKSDISRNENVYKQIWDLREVHVSNFVQWIDWHLFFVKKKNAIAWETKELARVPKYVLVFFSNIVSGKSCRDARALSFMTIVYQQGDFVCAVHVFTWEDAQLSLPPVIRALFHKSWYHIDLPFYCNFGKTQGSD